MKTTTKIALHEDDDDWN